MHFYFLLSVDDFEIYNKVEFVNIGNALVNMK